jgi:hypothetical protein
MIKDQEEKKLLMNFKENPVQKVQGFYGAGGRTRTGTVSRMILSHVRLPFRHTGKITLLILA